MKKIIFLLGVAVILMSVGCKKIAPNPYELTEAARKSMKPAQQEAYIERIKLLEELVTEINAPDASEEEIMDQMQIFDQDLPKDWSWKKNKQPMDKAWHFFELMKEGFKGSQKYTNYADCKDDVDALGKELADYFTQANERRKALIVNEERFYELYDAGIKSSHTSDNSTQQ